MPPPLVRLGILSSHRGSNFQALLDAADTASAANKESARQSFRPVLVISNNSNAPVLQRARAAAISTCHLSSRHHPDPAALDRAIADTLLAHRVDMVLTLGYMKRLGPTVLATFNNRIFNIHPSLLPRFGGTGMYGRHVHEAVLASGATVTGVTIHRVSGDYDRGEIIAQRQVSVRPGDDAERLAARVLAAEHDMLIATLPQLVAAMTANPARQPPQKPSQQPSQNQQQKPAAPARLTA